MPTKTQLRPDLRFASLPEVLADVEALAAGPVATGGDWTAAQVVDHLADAIDASIDGFPMLAPEAARERARPMREQVLREGLRPGLEVRGDLQRMMPNPDRTWDDALDHIRRAVARAGTERMTAEHAYLGRFTHEQWLVFHCRHAELHLGFLATEVR